MHQVEVGKILGQRAEQRDHALVEIDVGSAQAAEADIDEGLVLVAIEARHLVASFVAHAALEHRHRDGPDPEPVRTNERAAVWVGVAIWALLLAIALVRRDALPSLAVHTRSGIAPAPSEDNAGGWPVAVVIAKGAPTGDGG